MVDYALSRNETLKADTKKVKVLKHVECGNDLRRVEGGKLFCPHCMVAGFPVKAL